MKRFILAAFISMAVTPALACQYNTDCQVGSKCIKPAGKMEGVCAGGMNPGNANDQRPYRNQMDLTGKRGNTCNWDTECGVGGKCYKESGNIRGVCG